MLRFGAWIPQIYLIHQSDLVSLPGNLLSVVGIFSHHILSQHKNYKKNLIKKIHSIKIYETKNQNIQVQVHWA